MGRGEESMEKNIFFECDKKLSLMDYLDFSEEGRCNLGSEIPVMVYRLLEYSLKEQLEEEFGAEKQKEIFRNAGKRAGTFFAEKMLNLFLPVNEFVLQLQEKMQDLKIGILRIEKFDDQTGTVVLTVSEDADCSGLPVLGEAVCNYDEGFISGILSKYYECTYNVREIDCWATGDRVCRFCAEKDK